MAASTALRLSQIRPFTTEDIPQVADLHRRVFGLADRTSPELIEAYRVYLTEVFLNNPWRNELPDSCVYEENNGRITGFLGVMPRRMRFLGQVVQARITSQFVVDPDFRGRVGLKLLSATLAGPQDITIADESNADSRKLWEGLGGATSNLYSMRWFYPLRLCQFALWTSKKRQFLPPFVSAISQPVARILDGLVPRILKFPCPPSAPRVFGEDLDCETLSDCLSEVGRTQSIRPDYDHRSLSWVLQRAGQMQRCGRLQKVLVRTEKREIAGWYLYYANPGGVSEVIQLYYVKPTFSRDVLDHLLCHAWGQGATAVSGRMEPGMMQTFSDRHCIFHCGPQWVLIHSRRPELLNAFNGGTAGFSRLDGEWCFHFQ
jgi:Acetyltransferase (GNAT) domain